MYKIEQNESQDRICFHNPADKQAEPKNLLGDANNYFLCTTFINILILKECVSLLHENKIAG